MTGSLSLRHQASVWFKAVRFHSFTAAVVPILIGTGLALYEHQFDLLLFILMLVASVATLAGTNLSNDYYDHVKGIDTEQVFGSSGVIQQDQLTPPEVKRGMIAVFALATLCGLVIVWRTDWKVLIVALFSLAAAFFYTGGPKPLGYIALGELMVFLFMGPVMVCGAYYVLTGHLTWTAVLGSLPISCLVAAVLHANNIRDIEPDRKAGKLTTANLLGRTFANREYVALIVGTYLLLVVFILYAPRFWPTLLVLATIPAAKRLIEAVRLGETRPELNLLLRKTAGLHLQFGLLMTIGLLGATILERWN